MNKHSTEYLESIAPDIKRAAVKVSRQFPSVEYDDIYQNLWEYVLVTQTELIPGGGSAVGFLEQEARRQCAKELAERNPRIDDFFYSPASVRALLNAGALYYTDEGDIAGRSDLLAAYDVLTQGEKDSVRRAFLEGDRAHTQPGAAAMAVKRAIDRLAMEMNRIGERRSDWHIEREIAGYTGSRKHAKTWNEG